MIEKRRSLISTFSAPMVGTVLLATANLPVMGQIIFNGDHSLTYQQPDYRPTPVFIGYGEGEEGSLTLDYTWVTSGPGFRMADSDGSGTHNHAVLTIDSNSQFVLDFDQDGLADIIGYDGTAVINVDGTETPFGAPEDGNLRTRRISIAVLPDSFGTVNLLGEHASWNAGTRHIDIGIAGTGEVNVLQGAQILNAQRTTVGGSRWTPTSGQVIDDDTGEEIAPPYFPVMNGFGYLNVDGPGSLVRMGNHNSSWLRIGRFATGRVVVSNGGEIDLTARGGLEIWVGDEVGGDGELIIESGGIVSSNGRFRANSTGSDRGYVKVEGPGSELNINFNGTSFIGNTADAEGAIGILEVLDGGTANFGPNLIVIGNQYGATGEVIVDGAGASLLNGNHIQVGLEGTGRVHVRNGGRLETGITHSNVTSIGREVTGNGTVIVEDEGSSAIFHSTVWIASGSHAIESAGTGTGVLDVRNGGLVEVGNALHVRGRGSIVLDGGTVRLTGSEPATFSGPDTHLTGNGLFDSSALIIANGATLHGTGEDGIFLTGTLSGRGTVENVTVGGLLADDATLTLSNVRFVEDAHLTVRIAETTVADNLLVVDEQTDFTGVHLTVGFDSWSPTEDWSAQLFTYTGSGEHAYNFASVTLPDGWVLNRGVIHHSTVGLPGSTAFEDWADSFGLTGSDAAADANPSGDGHTNLAKFAFGANPLESVALLVEVVRDGDRLVLRWNRSTETGIEYSINQTTSLGSGDWTPIVGVEPVVMIDPDVNPPSGYERVEWSVDMASEGSRKFYSVVADIPDSLIP